MSIHDMPSRITFRPVTLDRVSIILREVACEFDVTVNDLRGDCKARHVSRPRQFAYVRLLDETPMSYPAIGRVMGGRDHTTIIYGERACRQRLKEGTQA